MKTQILSMRHAPISLIGFLLLVTTTLIGCGVFVNRLIGLDPVFLTQDDLHRMGLRKSERIRDHPYGIGGTREFHVIAGLEQRGYQLNVQYWLFNSSSTAKKAAEAEWIWTFAAMPNFHPELNPEDVIGDATWRRIHRRWKEWEKGPTDIYFVKYNLLVRIRTNGHPSNRLQFARDAARKIEAQIEALLFKDGRTIISGGREKDRPVRLWDVETGNILKTLIEHKDGALSVSFSPDGKMLVSGGWDKTVRLWDAETGNILKTFKGHKGSITSVSFSPNGKMLVSGGWDETVRLWDVETGNLLKTLKAHKERVTSVSFSPDGKRIVSGGYDETVRLWDVETGDLLKTHKGHKINVTSVSFSPDGKTLASGSWDETVRLWDTIKSRHRLWDAITGKPLKILKGHTGWIMSVSFSSDGRTLASGGADGTVRLWDVDTGHLLKTLPGHAGDVLSVSFSPDGKTLASGSVDGSVWLWDVETGNLLKTFEGHKGNVLSVSFLPDGRMLVGGSLDEATLLWGTSVIKR